MSLLKAVLIAIGLIFSWLVHAQQIGQTHIHSNLEDQHFVFKGQFPHIEPYIDQNLKSRGENYSAPKLPEILNKAREKNGGNLRPMQFGEDEQVVDPVAAIGAHGVGVGDEWGKRVNADQAYDQESDSSCQLAIHNMFSVVCNSNNSCEIESQFDQTCIKSGNAEKARDCVDAVNAYAQSCFGERSCKRDLGAPQLLAASLILDDNKVCTASFIKPNSSQLSVTNAATVEHCEVDGTNDIVQGSKFSDGVVKITNPYDIGLSDQLRSFQLLTQNFGHGIKLGPAKKFARTWFMAFNSLTSLRNKAVADYGFTDNRLPNIMCDASSLCTIVGVAQDGSLAHTCQSTRGGSGGPLIQIDDGRPVIVGLNEGANSSGKVSENLGTLTLQP